MTEPPAGAGSGASRLDPGLLARGPGRTARTLVRFAALSAIGALLFVFHGISANLTPWSQAIVNGIVKYAYGTAGQRDTTVVLFREENLRTLDESYPVSFERHAQVFEALSSYGPRALFADFAFVDRRRAADVERLSEAICELARAGTAVYLAVPASAGPGEPPSPILPELLRCAAPASAHMDAAHGASGVLTYDNGVPIASGFLATPAFAMAAQPVGLTPPHEQPMEIIWGNGVAPLNRKWMRCESPGPLTSLVRLLRQNPVAPKLRCPYTRTISVAHLLTSSGDPDVQDALARRAVFYGAAFQLTGDRVASPVYEELPGVYLHAMAHDNLITFGRNYKRARRDLVASAGWGLVIPLSAAVDGLLLMATVGILLLVDEPALGDGVRQRLVLAPASLRWGALGVAGVLAGAGLVMPALLPLALLGLPVALAVFAIVHLAAPGAPPGPPTRGFVSRHLAGVAAAVAAVTVFLAVDRRLGPEAALLLVALPGYFLYKVFVARDAVFVAMVTLVVLSSLISFLPPINLGPRNVVAYVAFFEVARHLVRRADHAAAAYVGLRRQHPGPREWGLNGTTLRVLDWLFLLCLRATSNKEIEHAKVAGQAG